MRVVGWSPKGSCLALWLLPAPALALVQTEVPDGVVGLSLVVKVGQLLEGHSTCRRGHVSDRGRNNSYNRRGPNMTNIVLESGNCQIYNDTVKPLTHGNGAGNRCLVRLNGLCIVLDDSCVCQHKCSV